MRTPAHRVAVALVGPYLVGAALTLTLAWPREAQAVVLAAVIVLLAGLIAETLLLSEQPESSAADAGVLSAALTSTLLLVPLLDRLVVRSLLAGSPWWPACAVAGALLVIGGGAMRLWARHALGRHFTHAVQLLPDHALIVRGPYRYVRHPAYLGTVLAVLGASLLLGSGTALLALVLCAPLGLGRIGREERLLHRRFGARFVEYAERVPRVVPLRRPCSRS